MGGDKEDSQSYALSLAVWCLVPPQDSASKKIIIRCCSLALDLLNYESKEIIIYEVTVSGTKL